MAVTRKDITTDPAVRDKYVDGVLRLKREVNAQSGLSTYDALVVWHVRAMMTMTPPSQGSRNAAHRGPVFLPWHRYMLITYEQQLQRILGDDTFGLESRENCAKLAAPPCFPSEGSQLAHAVGFP